MQAVPQQNTESASTSKQARSKQKFRKFKDRKAKKAPKRLLAKANKSRKLDQKCISKIKKKYNIQKNPHVQHKWQFLRNSPKKSSHSPKPKVNTPQEKIEKNIEPTEEGELIESSDDDDCVLLDTSITIHVDDSDADTDAFSRDKFFAACQRRAEKIATPKIFEDSQRQASLIIKQRSNNPLLYSTICKSDSAADISCINLLDSPESPLMPKPSYNHNDSVILLDDSIAGADFIPLMNPLAMNVTEKETPKREPIRKNIIKKSGRMSISQFTKEEKKKVGDYNSNTFNPTEETGEAGQSGDKPKSHKRSIIIDGSNVAFAHGNSNMFSSDGINYCLQYFEKMGHNAKAVVPSFRRNAFKSSNPEMLDKLHKQGKIVFTPCKNIPGQKSISYDDRFILQLAYEWNAAIVSNDNYRDLIDESPAFKKIVETRVLGYTWCDNIFILPKDPYGRWGPTLDEILKC